MHSKKTVFWIFQKRLSVRNSDSFDNLQEYPWQEEPGMLGYLGAISVETGDLLSGRGRGV